MNAEITFNHKAETTLDSVLINGVSILAMQEAIGENTLDTKLKMLKDYVSSNGETKYSVDGLTKAILEHEEFDENVKILLMVNTGITTFKKDEELQMRMALEGLKAATEIDDDDFSTSKVIEHIYKKMIGSVPDEVDNPIGFQLFSIGVALASSN